MSKLKIPTDKWISWILSGTEYSSTKVKKELVSEFLHLQEIMYVVTFPY